jgi:uncharacterized protein YfaQ (DUF2300 family)
MSARHRAVLVASLLLSLPLWAQSNWPDRLALGGDEPRVWRLGSDASSQPLPSELQTPLGSIWKLFVYSYLQDNGWQESPLQCDGSRPKEESYCCDPGETITRDQALIRSCGLYFSPQRLGLNANDWRHYWQSLQGPAWLTDIHQLREERYVQVSALLQALAIVPAAAQAKASATLSGIMLQGRGKAGVGALGLLLRAKSYTLPTAEWGTIGGGAGWSDTGTPLWFGGQGGSPQVFQRLAPQMASILLQQPEASHQACVQVRFFARYPLAHLLGAQGTEAKPGALQGNYQLQFANGQQLSWQAEPGHFWLEHPIGQQAIIQGRFSEIEYVARVIDREGDAHHGQASRALAVAARSYLRQQASHQGDCLQLDDSSHFQRVSPHTPSAAAIAAARSTHGLVLQGVEVRYHSSRPDVNRLSWQQAVQEDKSGFDFTQILARAYPDASLQLLDHPLEADCQPLHEAQTWLQYQAPHWQSQLRAEPGFEAPVQPLGVCLLTQGRPYADKKAQRIYVRPNPSQDGRIALTHEYLHLAFAHHPMGEDETYIENLARRLVRGEP